MATFCENNYFDNLDCGGGFVWQSYGKQHKKALGKARKSVAGGKSMKVVSEFCYCWESKVISLRILESI